MFQAYRANFLNLLMEFMEVMNDQSLNIWLDPDTVIPHGSLALRLQKIIDGQFVIWQQEQASGVRSFSDLTVNAQEVLGAAYNANAHLNVRLYTRSQAQSFLLGSAESKGRLLEDIIYGLCFHQPVNRFLKSLGTWHRPAAEYVNRIQGAKNRTKQRMTSRTKMLRALQQFYCQRGDDASYWGFIMIPEMLEYVFLYNPGDNVTEASIQRLLEQLSTPSHEDFRHSVQALAQAYGRHVSLLGSFPKRGKRGLPTYEFQARPPVTQPVPSIQPSSAGRKRKNTATNADEASQGRKETRLRPSLDFAPDEALLRASALEGFDRLIFEYLGHSFHVGRTILQHQPQREQILKQWATGSAHGLNGTVYTDPLLALHIEKAARVWCPGDKYIIFRRRGPSMQLINNHYPMNTPIRDRDESFQLVFLWRLFLWRMYAFGKQSRLEKIARLRSLDDWKSMVSEKKKEVKGNVPGYAQFRINPPSRQLEVFSKVWMALPNFLRILRTATTPTFASVRDLFQVMEIPYLPPSGLVTWLIICDLSEYGLCQPPTSRDLADKIGDLAAEDGRHGAGGSGPSGAFAVIAKERSVSIPYRSSTEVKESLERVEQAFQATYGAAWKEIMGREFNMADMEHALCKITREWKGQGKR
jgi:hypothetical protein